jgi:hypothetical protein
MEGHQEWVEAREPNNVTAGKEEKKYQRNQRPRRNATGLTGRMKIATDDTAEDDACVQ